MNINAEILEFVSNYWEYLFGLFLIALGFIVDIIDRAFKREKQEIFNYGKMPVMSPIEIKTKDRSFFKAIWVWFFGDRKWILKEDFEFELSGKKHYIPKGFVFDGASVPRFLWVFLSPVGILLLGSMIHDYLYEYGYLPRIDGSHGYKGIERVGCDRMFRDICIDVNGMIVLNSVAYLAVRIGGWVGWKRRRKTRKYQ